MDGMGYIVVKETISRTSDRSLMVQNLKVEEGVLIRTCLIGGGMEAARLLDMSACIAFPNWFLDEMPTSPSCFQ